MDLKLYLDSAHLLVEDNGQGLDLEEVNSKGEDAGFGLAGMDQRASLLGGSFSLHSQIDKGTLVEVKIPLL